MNKKEKKRKCLVIDGNNLVYRSYYASQKIKWKGEDKDLYIFLRILVSVMKKGKYEKVFIAFDEKKETFRNSIIAEYKAKRKKMPEEIFNSLKRIKMIVEKMKIYSESSKNFEADDLIASFIERFKSKNDFEFHILSQDKDLSQLISENVKVLKYKNGNLEKIDKEKFFNENKFSSEEFVYYLALTGDEIDNIKGVEGIGKKRASLIVSKFGNIEKTFENLNELPREIKLIIEEKKGKIKKNIEVIKLIKNIDVKNWESYDFSLEYLKKNKDFVKFCEEKNMKSIVNFLK